MNDEMTQANSEPVPFEMIPIKSSCALMDLSHWCRNGDENLHLKRMIVPKHGQDLLF